MKNCMFKQYLSHLLLTSLSTIYQDKDTVSNGPVSDFGTELIAICLTVCISTTLDDQVLHSQK